MASVNDYGGQPDTLASVPLGGVGGWAEAVAAALDNSDTPISQRGTYVKRTGDTMTGPLVLPGDPSAALHAATKSYVDGTDVAPIYATSWKTRASHRAAFRKVGAMILCQMSLDVTANVTSSGTTVSVGTIPAGYRPAEYVGMPATWVNNGGAPGSGLLIAYPDGQFRFLFPSGQTLTPGTHVAASGSWPAT